MRKIELKVLGGEFINSAALIAEIGKDAAEKKFAEYVEINGKSISYRNLLVEVLTFAGNGIPSAEVRKRWKLAGLVEAAGDILLIEDADYEKLCSIVEGFDGWTAVSRNLVQFLGDVLDAPTVEVTAK